MDARQSYEIHPAAELFPMMTGSALDELAEDIRLNGQREPITFYAGKLLDGRNRLNACELLAIEPITNELDVEQVPDPVSWVLSTNLHRRHLTDQQRAMVASKVALLSRGRPALNNPQDCGFNVEQAASLLDVPIRKVEQAKRVNRDGAVEVAAMVERGEVKLSTAEKLVKLVPDRLEQAEIASQGEEAIRKACHVANNSGDNEWYTPDVYLEAARQAFGGAIDLDPASSAIANERVRAGAIYTAEDDGLSKRWFGNVWLNPPYAQPLVRLFCEKLIASVRSGEVVAAVVLVNNATETAWFQELMTEATGICFPKGRVKFWKPEAATASPLQGQAFLYIGDHQERFVAAFRQFGSVLGGAL